MKYSVYNIDDWADLTFYSKWDIVKYGDFYYYALADHTSTSVFDIDLKQNGLWDGVGVDDSGKTRPRFIWKPSHPLPIPVKPRVKTISYGDGYEKRAPDGINNNLITLNCRFESKNLAEATAISHFLYQRQGIEAFLFTPPKPFNKEKKFKCQEFEPNFEFYDSYTITATFEEVVN